ncbi:hypothetical protein GE061_007561 [Apolygus lucorum]|uniref:Uncharacterized protein n=1 Tax=Apolygus lucorum TaxID=248454 RepID=A0A8S9WW36_APOLU|nr:hypothetical protein GE061_007561 [Apolygus lucorum]
MRGGGARGGGARESETLRDRLPLHRATETERLLPSLPSPPRTHTDEHGRSPHAHAPHGRTHVTKPQSRLKSRDGHTTGRL